MNDGQIGLALGELRKAKAEVSGDPILMGAVTFYEVNAHRLLAEESLAQGDYEEAEKHARETVSANPSYADMRTLLGKALIKLARFEEAIQQFQEALDLNPHFLEAMVYQAAALARLGHTAQTRRFLEKARKIAQTRCLESEYDLAFKCLREKKGDQAAEHIEKAFDFSCSKENSSLEAGLSLSKQSRWEEALEELEKALHQSSTFADVRNQMGIACSELGRFQEAVEHFRKALDINPHFIAARLNLGFALSKSGKHLEALEELKMVVSQSTGEQNSVTEIISRLSTDSEH